MYNPNKHLSIERFLSLKTPTDLCVFLETNFNTLSSIASSPTYRSFTISKKKGGFRFIEAPVDQLRYTQYKLSPYLQNIYSKNAPSCVHGFVTKLEGKQARNIVTNASPHVAKEYVLNIDLKDFFHNVTTEKVKNILLEPPFNFTPELSACLTLLCTINGRLPIGSPTSPSLANFSCLKLDKLILEYSENQNLTYTRYADDLTFSRNESISGVDISEIEKLVKLSGFEVNRKKIRIQDVHSKQSVTGILVNQKVNVDRRYLRKLRAILHNWETKGIYEASARYYGLNYTNEKQIETFKKSVLYKLLFVKFVKGEDCKMLNNLIDKYRFAISLSPDV